MFLRFGLNGGEEMTQKDVADLLGISQSYISRLEKRLFSGSGKKSPKWCDRSLPASVSPRFPEVPKKCVAAQIFFLKPHIL